MRKLKKGGVDSFFRNNILSEGPKNHIYTREIIKKTSLGRILKVKNTLLGGTIFYLKKISHLNSSYKL